MIIKEHLSNLTRRGHDAFVATFFTVLRERKILHSTVIVCFTLLNDKTRKKKKSLTERKGCFFHHVRSVLEHMAFLSFFLFL